MDATTDSLTTGTIYKLRYLAVNTVGGSGTASDPVSVALVDKPAAPATITKSMTFSSKTSLRIEWSTVTIAAGQTPVGDVLGYILYATDPTNGTTWEAFNGVALGLRDQVGATVLGLTTGRMYQFQVRAYNYNGAGTMSSVFEFYSCILPSSFVAPYRITSTALTIDIGWTEPGDTGGCALTGYAIFKDDGAGTGTFSEANTASDPTIRNQPGLSTAQITTFSASDLGLPFVIYLEVYTEAGDSSSSEHEVITLGDVPNQPTVVPYKDTTQSTGSQLLINYDALAASENGGLAILSYSLEMDDGQGGVYTALTGAATASLASSHFITTSIV